MAVAGDGGDPAQWPWHSLCAPACPRVAQPQQWGQRQSRWDKGAARGRQRGHAGVPAATLGPGGCSDPARAAQAGRRQSWGGPGTLGRGCPGAPGPAAGCPRVNESLLLLQTISDIFADNATLSLCRLPGSTSPAAPAAPLRRLPSAPRSGGHRTPHPAPRTPHPAPRTAPRHLARRRSAAAAALQSQAEQPAPLAAL